MESSKARLRGDRVSTCAATASQKGFGTLLGVSDFYREVILDHYKNPRGHGPMESPDASAEGLNPLCGDEVTISVALGVDGETIEEVMFEGRGCAISQAATSMLTEMVTSSPQSGLRPSAEASGASIGPWPRGFL